MTTKLKIDMAEGILEVEGSEAFVKAIYNDFKRHFIGEEATVEPVKSKPTRRTRTTLRLAKAAPSKPEAQPPSPEPVPQSAGAVSETVVKPKEPAPALPKTKTIPAKPKTSYTFIKELDLSAADGRPSLVEFMDAKFPITNEERNLVFLHYMQYTLKAKSLTIDHVYTCYRAAKIRAPLDLEASLQATFNQKRWIKITKTGKLSVTPAGRQYVEKQLPKKIKN